MKTFLLSLFSFLIKSSYVFILVIIVIAIFILLFFSSSSEIREDKTFRVEGHAKMAVVPDEITLRMGVLKNGKDVLALQNESNSIINNFTKTLVEFGIPEKNIKTSVYQLNPQYKENSKEIEQYSLNIELEVLIKDINTKENQAGEIIAIGLENSLNEVRTLTYDISNLEEINDQLKIMAIEDAKLRKDSLASASGLRIGNLKNIEQGYYYPLYDNYALSATEVVKEEQNTENSEVINVNPGQTEISANVVLEFEII